MLEKKAGKFVKKKYRKLYKRFFLKNDNETKPQYHSGIMIKTSIKNEIFQKAVARTLMHVFLL